ncbi:MAG: oxidoreductase [Asticcacaulis sp.]
MAYKPVKTCVVGFGSAGRIIHVPLVRATPGLELAAVVSSRPAEVEAAAPGTAVFADFDAMVADPSIELVVLATPNTLHAPQAVAALRAGKNVVIDKPFGVNLAEAEAVAQAAKASGKLACVFQNRRWDSHILTLKRFLDEDRLGEVAEAILRYDRLRDVSPERWRDQDLPGSGMWFDLGTHLVDQAVHLFGRPDTVMADIFAQRLGAMTNDWFLCILGYGRTRVVLHSGMVTPVPGAVVEVQGSGGAFIKYGQDTQEDMLRAGRTPGDQGWGVDPSPAVFTPAIGTETRAAVEVSCQPGNYPAFYAGIAAAIRDGAPSPVPIEQSLIAMQIIELGLQSAHEGRRLVL